MAIPPIGVEAKVNIGTPTRSPISGKPELFQPFETNTPSLLAPSFWAGFNRFNDNFADAVELQLTGRKKQEQILLLFFMALSLLQTAAMDPVALAFFIRMFAAIQSLDAQLSVSEAISKALVKAFQLKEEAARGRGLLGLPIPPDRFASEAERDLYTHENILPWEEYKNRFGAAADQFSQFDGASDAETQAANVTAQQIYSAAVLASNRTAAITRRASHFG